MNVNRYKRLRTAGDDDDYDDGHDDDGAVDYGSPRRKKTKGF